MSEQTPEPTTAEPVAEETAPTSAPFTPITSQAEYEKGLASRLQKQRSQFERQLADAKVATERTSLLEQQLAQTTEKATTYETKWREKSIEAELRVAALNAQVVNPDDALRLIDKSSLTVTDDGVVEGANELLAEFLSTRPFYIKQQGSTPTPVPPVAAGQTKPTEKLFSMAEVQAMDNNQLSANRDLIMKSMGSASWLG
jgi:hypothetical protein